MAEYDEFEVSIQPNVQRPGDWSITLESCKLAALAGAKGDVPPAFRYGQLQQLRSHGGWPDKAKLDAIGQSVADSLLTDGLRAALEANLAVSGAAGRGTRLVFSMIGEDAPLPAAQGGEARAAGDPVRLQELPVEALLVDANNFIALDPMSPLSRSLRFKRDRQPLHVALPLRVLVVAAAPTGLPEAQVADEKQVIRTAFGAMADKGGAFTLEFCEPPTKKELVDRLARGYHILHFAGHGAFDIIGDDPTPRPHLLLEQENGEKASLDADTLDSLLSNSGIRLVVMTACASAAPTPEEVEGHVGPFCGVAQKLVSGISGVSAAVAMQLDLASDAAVEFSRTFYTQLLSSGRKLDEIVALCRKALSTAKGVNDRAWVTPVIYWRCVDGQVFDIEPMRGVFDEPTRIRLSALQRQIDQHLDDIREMLSQPPNIVAALAGLIGRKQQQVDELTLERGALMGETLRLLGGQAAAGGTVTCRVLLRLRTPAQVGDVRFDLQYDAAKAAFGGAAPGAACHTVMPFTNAAPPGKLAVLLNNVSQGAQWAPGEYELATVAFQVAAGVADKSLLLRLDAAGVTKDGAAVELGTLDGIVFVT